MNWTNLKVNHKRLTTDLPATILDCCRQPAFKLLWKLKGHVVSARKRVKVSVALTAGDTARIISDA